MMLDEHHQRIDGNADHDGRNAVEHVGGEAHDVAGGVAAVLSEIDAGAHTQRYANEGSDTHDHGSADNGVSHASPGLAHRLGNPGEESPGDGADASIDHRSHDQEERHEHHQGGADNSADPEEVHEAAAETDVMQCSSQACRG